MQSQKIISFLITGLLVIALGTLAVSGEQEKNEGSGIR